MLPRCQRHPNRVNRVEHLRVHLPINGARPSEITNDKEIQGRKVDHWGKFDHKERKEEKKKEKKISRNQF